MKIEYDDAQLLCYLQKEIKDKRKQENLMQMMKLNNSDEIEEKSCMSLQLALYHHNKLKEVIFQMIDIGGKKLLMQKDCW